MPRPRIHDFDAILDAAEQLIIDGGPGSATIRAVASATEASNGSIYHAYPSRSHLLGAVWLRAAHRFLSVQQHAVAEALGEAEPDSQKNAIAAVVAAAEAPIAFAQQHPNSSKLIFTVSRSSLLRAGLPAELSTAANSLDSVLTELFIRLSQALWARQDSHAVQVIQECLVQLPTAFILRSRRPPDTTARRRLEAAVRAVLEVPLPPARGGSGQADQIPSTTPPTQENQR